MPCEHNHGNPWMFRRDELDLLEHEFDEIFHRHDAAKHSPSFGFEEDILKEHLDTEEASEAELALRMGPRWLEHPGPERIMAGPSDADAWEPGTVRSHLRQESARDPFYEQTYLWARALFRWSGDAYAEGRQTPDLFRAHVNAYLVPAKIASAQAEETHEDADGMEAAAHDYAMAATYLDRVRESLHGLAEDGVLPSDRKVLLEEADKIATVIHQSLKRLDQIRKFRPS